MTARTVRILRRTLTLAVGLAVAAVLTGACQARLEDPGDTSQIVKVDEQVTGDGWHYEFFRNEAYPCSLEGYQTFVIGTRIGDDPDDARPLWVRQRGGGAGWFDADGTPQPDDDNLTEDGLTQLRSQLRQPGLVSRVLDLPDEFRGLAVSMCNRDFYGGANNADPNNFDDEGTQRRTNGLLATKAAIRFTMERHTTTDFFLHGGSAGALGTVHVAYALERQGLAPTGIVPDGGIRNDAWETARLDQDICTSRYGSPEFIEAFGPRIHSELRAPELQPHELVASGDLGVPLVYVWSHGDPTSCGAIPMVCPLEDGPVIMGATDCKNEPVRRAVEAQGPDGRSLALGVCVTNPDSDVPCDTHVSTRVNRPNTNDTLPADYLGLIVDWVEDRLAETDEVVLGASFACPFPGEDERRQTFLVGGDADAVAVGAVTDHLPATLTTGDPRLSIWQAGSWQPLVPTEPTGGFGPELSFAWTLGAACPDHDIAIIKQAAPSAPIATWTPGGTNWSGLGSQLNNAINAGEPLVLRGALVHQGQSDTTTLADATSWSAGFLDVVDALRATATVPNDLPVLYVTERRNGYPDDVSAIDPDTTIGLLAGGPYTGHLLTQQWQAQQQRPGLFPVLVRDPWQATDGQHHDTRGARTVGQSLAVTYLTDATPTP